MMVVAPVIDHYQCWRKGLELIEVLKVLMGENNENKGGVFACYAGAKTSWWF